MNLSFKNRIALSYMLATAAMVAVVFLVIFSIVKSTVYRHLDNDLTHEAGVHTREVEFSEGGPTFINKREWEEREHRMVEVHPVFIQLVSLDGQVMDKSPNLKAGALQFDASYPASVHFTTELNGSSIRQVQVPIFQGEEPMGYLLAALSFQDAQMVLRNLEQILLISFPVILLVLFGITRFLAGRSIQPVVDITQTANRITRNHLNERINLPGNQDELYALTTSLNELLDRLELAILRERQFTSDASHELRTPLAVLRGTFEVLIRKPRTQAEYEEKIQTGIQEIDRLTHIAEQLLLLARFDHTSKDLHAQEILLVSVVDDALIHLKSKVSAKSLKVEVLAEEELLVVSDPHLLRLVIENLLANAIKYSHSGGSLQIEMKRAGGQISCAITDQGIGIRPEDQAQIFQPFFRSEPLTHKHIRGQGLGLSIVQKACSLLNIDLHLNSEVGKGSTFSLLFHNNLSSSPA
jgi:signal transduction histidine kinase